MENIAFYCNKEKNTFERRRALLTSPKGMDVLVEVKAVSVNPADLKLSEKAASIDKILGYDVVGIISETGAQATGFQVGDRVYYAGTTGRDGGNQRYQLVDSRIIAKVPASLTDAEAAALPLTGLTAWELLFEQMGLRGAKKSNTGRILLVNAGGGVGSIAGQLAAWSGLSVSGTSSQKNFSWLKENGISDMLDYHQDLLSQAAAGSFDYIASFFDVTDYLPALARLVKPFGKIGTIVETKADLPMNLLKNNNVNFYWEYMFAKTDHGHELSSQGAILRRLAELLEAGTIHSTLTQEISGGINEKTLGQAYEAVSQGHPGKVVVSGGVL